MMSRFFAIAFAVCFFYKCIEAVPTTNNEIVYDNKCMGSIISNGFGYNSHDEDCSCYYMCKPNRDHNPQFSSFSYISHKMCCPCGMSFSKKKLSCVEYYSPYSDCFDTSLGTNPCSSLADGTKLTRTNPEDASPGSILCSGFLECDQVGSVVVPDTECCPENTCYDQSSLACTAAACDVGYCATLNETLQYDCDCNGTEAPEQTCQFQEDPTNNTIFTLGSSVFNCPMYTVWSQINCSCILSNPAHPCSGLAFLGFETDANATDGIGNRIWTEASGSITVSGQAAIFSDPGGQINVAGLAYTYRSNDFVLNFEFVLTDDDTSSVGTRQCMVGDSFLSSSGSSTDSDMLAVTVDRATGSSGTALNLKLTYHDDSTIGDNTETVQVAITGNYAVDTVYKFWLIYNGDDEEFGAAVLDDADNIVSSVRRNVPGSVQLKPSFSGFLFGDCPSGSHFEGQLREIAFYRLCRPNDPELQLVESLLLPPISNPNPPANTPPIGFSG